jgi:hypothetical protein
MESLMNLSRVRPGDRVTVNVRGRVFDATVDAKLADGRLRLNPPAGITYYHCTARQVTGHQSMRWKPTDAVVRVAGEE